jgi:hypothetical protein
MLKKGYTIEDNTVYETYPYQKNGQIRNQKTSGNSCFELAGI